MEYTLREKRFRGHPVVEILKDGEAFGADLPTMEHFSFGVKKARLIVGFLDEVEAFANTGGREPRIATPIREAVPGLGPCVYEKHSEFEAFGRTIERPYLELEGAGDSIGLGVTKAEAICDLEDELRAFVNRHTP